MANHNELGEWGEERAAQFLQSQGYEILERNFRFKKAEIDIIARLDNQLIVCEVKTRNSSFFGDPQSFVSKVKIKLLITATNEYIERNNLRFEVRFDIIAILKNKHQEQLDHYPNAFYHF